MVRMRWPQWRCPHAFPPPSTALRGPTGSSKEGPSGGVRMRFPHSVQRFWPHMGLHRRPQWRCPH
eukprot:2857005-Pyramimonas_sp.AAC.1